jgi:hypothetical protein
MIDFSTAFQAQFARMIDLNYNIPGTIVHYPKTSSASWDQPIFDKS